MDARAHARSTRIPARKARLVVDLIRGKDVEESLRTLGATQTKGARIVTKVLNSAVANALVEEGIDFDAEDLYVKEAYVNEGPTMRRFRPRAMGRATRINKRTSHITIVLAVHEGVAKTEEE